MDEKKRTKILAAGLVAVIAVYSLRSTLDGFLMKPIRDLQRNLNIATAENESLKLQEIKFKVGRLMREHGLQPRTRRRFTTTTDSNHDQPQTWLGK